MFPSYILDEDAYNDDPLLMLASIFTLTEKIAKNGFKTNISEFLGQFCFIIKTSFQFKN